MNLWWCVCMYNFYMHHHWWSIQLFLWLISLIYIFIWICIQQQSIPSHKHTHTHTHTYIYMYIYLYIYKNTKEGRKVVGYRGSPRFKMFERCMYILYFWVRSFSSHRFVRHSFFGSVTTSEPIGLFDLVYLCVHIKTNK